MPKGIYKRIIGINHFPEKQGFQKGHPFYKGVEKGWFKKGTHPSPKTEFKKRNQCAKGNKPNKTSFQKGHIISKGENNWRWIKDRTKLQRYNDTNKDRRSSAYNFWRLEVYKRDNFKCRINNCDCSGRIIAHHILSWKNYPELRFNINNGITLCLFHHPRKKIEEQKLIPFFQGIIKHIGMEVIGKTKGRKSHINITPEAKKGVSLQCFWLKTMNTQVKNSFDPVTLKKIGKGALIAMGGALCVYLLDIIPGLDFGSATPAIVGVASIIINSIKEYLKGQ